MRLRTIQAGPAMQMPVFLVLFLAPVYVPLDLLTGWVEIAAHVNPVTALLEAGRGLISGGDAVLACRRRARARRRLRGLGVRGLRKAEAAGGWCGRPR